MNKKWAFVPLVLVMGLVWYEFAVSRVAEPEPHSLTSPQAGGATLAAASRATTAPAVMAQQVTLETLMRDLTADDEATRRVAEAFLARVPVEKREWLRRQAGKANDRVRGLLEKRVDEIENLLATNPPPISLHVKDATLPDVIAALNDEMGTDMKHDSFGGNRPGLYTLDMTDRPFWEVIAALNAQRMFQIRVLNGELTISDSDVIGGDAGMGHGAISGPFFMYAYVSPLEGTRPASFMLTYYILADPRMHVADLQFGLMNAGSNVAAVSADSNGNTMKYMGRSGAADPHAAAAGYRGSFQLIWPDNPGKTISLLHAQAGFVTEVPGQVMEVAGIEARQGWEEKLGDVVVSMPQFEIDTRVNFQFKVSPVEKAPLTTFYLTNDRGQLVWSKNAGMGEQGLLTAMVPFPRAPYGLRVTVAKQVHELAGNFDIRDIPLPAR